MLPAGLCSLLLSVRSEVPHTFSSALLPTEPARTLPPALTLGPVSQWPRGGQQSQLELLAAPTPPG